MNKKKIYNIVSKELKEIIEKFSNDAFEIYSQDYNILEHTDKIIRNGGV